MFERQSWVNWFCSYNGYKEENGRACKTTTWTRQRWFENNPVVEGADKSTDAENILLMMPILLMYSIIFRTASLKGIEFDKLFWRLIH